MKKMFSSLLAVLTSAFVLSGTGIAVCAQGVETEISPAGLSDAVLTIGEYEEESGTELSVLSNFAAGSYNYGDLLDKNNAAVYESFKGLVEPSTDKLTISLPVTVTFETSSKSMSSFTDDDSAAFSQAIFSACKPGIDSAMFDYPEIFWLDTSNMGISIGSDTKCSYSSSSGVYKWKVYTLTISPKYYDAYGSLEGVNEYKDRLGEAVSEFATEGATRYDTLKALHDKIAVFTYYDTEATFSDSPIGALVEPGVVCEGYSEAFKLCCDSLGIPCVLVFGNYNAAIKTAHMWNYVQMEDGKWYAVDVTWDDLDNENVVKYAYFLKGSESFNTNHTPSSDFNITQLTYPELSETDYVQGAQTEYAAGDLNRDGYVDIADLVYCYRAVMGDEVEYSCDANGDGKVSSLDMAFMRRLIIE